MSAAADWTERLTDRLAARGLLPPWGRPAAHPAFSDFPPMAVAPDGLDIDYLGVRTQEMMLPPYWRSPPPASKASLPAFDEEYFEWVDILEAVRAARGRFTMIEFGAGYARWAVRGWTAARRLGLSAHVGVVEAEPQHVLWAKSHMALNGIPDSDITFVESAVGEASGETVFLVEMPPGSAGNTPRDWYGQAVTWSPMQDAVEIERQYCGRPLVQMPGGWTGIRVGVQTLSSVLARFDRVDLADFDVQGAETAVIREAIGPLSEQVRRLHIGTHSRTIDAELPDILRPAGWRCLRSYLCLRWNRTEFGWIRFNDGVQTWVNDRLI